VSWEQLLSSLGFKEHGSKTQNTTHDKKTRVSTRNGNTSKSTKKVQEASLVARDTRSIKRKLILQQGEEIKHEPKFSASKQEFVGCDKVYTRRMTRKKTHELQR
jgi:hypothetical protein